MDMTREEAITRLHWLKRELIKGTDMNEPIDMAIEALSADAVQGFRGGKIPPNEMLNGTVLIPQHQWIEMERELAELKEKFESADRPSGKWIDMNTKEESYYPRYKCSLCGNWANHSNYCPSCGAKMEGGTE